MKEKKTEIKYESQKNEIESRTILSDISKKIGVNRSLLELMLVNYLKEKHDEGKMKIDLMKKELSFK